MNTIQRYRTAYQSPFTLPELPDLSRLPKDGPTVLVFAPHPDDEVIIGTLPLRMRRELNARVINIAVTLGSDPERRDARREELKRACSTVDFELHELGYIGVTLETRENRPEVWTSWVAEVAEQLRAYQPHAVFVPHDNDGHPAHIGTHHLVMDALAALAPAAPRPHRFLTEFWHAMFSPNLMVECSDTDLSLLLAALAAHTGEVERNPYHRRLPAWMIDNTRRGAERVQLPGAAAPDFVFSTLYAHFLPEGAPAQPGFIGQHDPLSDILDG